MKSIQVIASLLCGILYCGISLNAQNVLKATGWMPEHTFTSGIEGPAVDSEGNLYAVNYKKEGTTSCMRGEHEQITTPLRLFSRIAFFIKSCPAWEHIY